MAKGIGLIGNFRGKVGNMVGYNLKDSNNKQTQGVRVYQPIVKNPKTAAQAEQRAKLAPINATYRALKQIIDRGQEGKAYGNKSRLAWLSDAMKAFNGGWFEKGTVINAPAIVPITKGSLPGVKGVGYGNGALYIILPGMTDTSTVPIATVSAALLSYDSSLKEGDQLTFIAVKTASDGMTPIVESFVLDTTATGNLSSNFKVSDTAFIYCENETNIASAALVVSREGNNGAHLRSTAVLNKNSAYPSTNWGDTAKTEAIESYMSQGANTDWAEESLQD